MRKIIALLHLSLDGIAAPTDNSLDWAVYNDEIQQYSHDLHSITDTAIYGRVTYEGMQQYWPSALIDPNSDEATLAHARWYDAATKIVVSRTLDRLDAKNTVLMRDRIAEQITQLKQQSGKHIWLIGSPTLTKTFMELGLIDEYRFNVNPVLLGSGIAIHAGFSDRRKLKLIEARTFKGGVVGLRYEPA